MVQRTDPEAKRAKLKEWLKTKLPSAEDVSISPLDKAAAGFGSEIHFFDLRWREAEQDKIEKLVIREEPRVLRVFPVYDMSAEFNTMRCLEDSTVPLPRMYWLEEDENALGAPFSILKGASNVIQIDRFGKDRARRESC